MDTRNPSMWRAALLPLLLTGCASTTPGWDARFGQDVRVMLARQVLDPEAVRNDAHVSGIDSQAARAALERYQHSFTQPAAAPAPMLAQGNAK